MPSESGRHATKRSTYALVFAGLAVITTVEIALVNLGLPRATLSGLFLLLSLSKAALVAAFYMHLRGDARLYSYIFVLPALLLAIFVILAGLS